MFRAGNWNVAKWDKLDPLAGDYTIVPYPSFGSGSGNFYEASLRGLAVPENAPNKEAALEFAPFILSKGAQQASLDAMGGSADVTAAARTYFTIRIWSAPLALANYVVLGWLIGQARAKLALAVQIAINLVNMATTALLVLGLGFGIAGAALAAVLAEGSGLVLGVWIARHLMHGRITVPRKLLLDRAGLMRMLTVNRDIMIRTAALITAFLFFTAQGARAGDVTLAANSVLNNFLLVSAFFLDGLANAAEQLCGQAFGAHDRAAFSTATRLVVFWGFVFAVIVMVVFALFGPALIDIMSASQDVRDMASEFLIFVIASPLLAVLAFAFDGVYIGATWARDMRNLMLAALAIFLLAWLALRSFGNAGLWGALLAFYAARGSLEALRYPALLRTSFGKGIDSAQALS